MTARRLRVLFYVACLLPVDLTVGASLLAAQLLALFFRGRSSRPVLRPPETGSVTILILSWDGRPLLEEFLPSVLEAAGKHEVMVVDNGSKDDSVQFLQTRFPKVRVLKLDRNYGYSEGNNRGIKQVTTDIVVLLNNDMAVDPDFLNPLLKPFSDPAVFAVASQIEMADKSKSRVETGKTRARFDAGLFYLWHDQISPQEEGLESLFFIDADMLFDPMDVVHLLTHPAPVIGGGRGRSHQVPCNMRAATWVVCRQYSISRPRAARKAGPLSCSRASSAAYARSRSCST